MKKLLLLLLFVSFWAQGQENINYADNEGPWYIVEYNSDYVTWFPSPEILLVSESSCRDNIRSQGTFTWGVANYIENNAFQYFNFVSVGDVNYRIVGTTFVSNAYSTSLRRAISRPNTGHLAPDGFPAISNPTCTPFVEAD